MGRKGKRRYFGLGERGIFKDFGWRRFSDWDWDFVWVVLFKLMRIFRLG